MKKFVALFIIVASALVQTTVCAAVRLQHEKSDKRLSSTTVKLLTSFTNCIVYIFDWGLKPEKEYPSTEYMLLYSDFLNCAVILDTFYKSRNSSNVNPRFENLKAHPLFTKQTKTLINLYPPSATASISLKNVTTTNDIYRAIFWYNIPFSYVLIFMSKKQCSTIQNVGWLSKFVEISSPAVYMLILDEQDVNIVGFAQAFRSAPCLFRAQSLQECYFRELHKIIHKDLQGTIARIRTLGSLKMCRFAKLLDMHPNYCAANAMAEHFNMTLLNTNDHPLPKLSIAQMYVRVAINDFTLKKLSRQTESNFKVVNLAIFYEETSFICIVAEKNSIGLKALVQAYDLLTWMVTVTVSAFLSGTIAAMAEKSSFSFWSRLLSASPVVLLLLIERFYEHAKVVRAASRQIILVISLWAFGAMLLGMCYSGNMVSQLTSPILPTCPQNMQQLAEIEEYRVLTDARFSYNGVRFSLFHKQIDEYLEQYAHNNDSYASTLRRFGKTVTFVNGTVLLSPSNYNTSAHVLYSYAGRKLEVQSLGIWTMMHSRKIRVLDGGNLPHFTVRSPLLVQTNVLSPIIQRFMADLCKSGIWNHWLYNRLATIVRDEFKYYVKKGELEVPKIWAKGSTLAAIWRNFDPMVDREHSCSALTLNNFNAVFSFIGICLLLSLCVMIKEKCPLNTFAYQLLYMVHVFYIFACGRLQRLVKNASQLT